MAKQLFIFVDESGLTNVETKQHYLVVAFALMHNRDFSDQLIFKIKDECKKKGKPIEPKEVKYHDLSPFQKEIAVQIVNSNYRNFYLAFVDLEKSHKAMVTGSNEFQIQTKIICELLCGIDKNKLNQYDEIRIIMDKKLAKEFQGQIEKILQIHLGTKKGISVETSSSGRERGIQIADLIAGAFRAKLMKKSDLFHADFSQVFQINVPEIDVFKLEKFKGN